MIIIIDKRKSFQVVFADPPTKEHLLCFSDIDYKAVFQDTCRIHSVLYIY